MHAEKCHSLKSFGLFLVPYICSLYFFNKGYTNLGIRKKIDDTGVPLLGSLSEFGPLACAYAVGSIIQKMRSQGFEREADLLAQKRLAPTYGADALAMGAATFFFKRGLLF